MMEKQYDKDGNRIRKNHEGILGEISKILLDQHSLIYYPFWNEIMEKIEQYGGPFTVGKTYQYRLRGWLKDEEETGVFDSQRGKYFIFRKVNELPQYDSTRELVLEEIVTMEEIK